VRGPSARSAAESRSCPSRIAVFRVAFDRWVSHDDGRGLPEFISESVGELKALTIEARELV
jgi:hypothetical protein